MAAKGKKEAEVVEETGFDYGTDKVQEVLGTFKMPEVGDHSARLAGIIHLGMYRESFNGELKKPAHQVLAIFELKDDEDFEDDGVTPLYIHKSFPLKKGDKAFMTKFLKAIDPKGSFHGFDDCIGAACTVNVTASKKLDSDGKHKYVNFGGLSGLPAKFATHVAPLVHSALGHLRQEEITEEAILHMNPVTEVANILMKCDDYEGSVAEEIINKIREKTPDFAKYKEKSADQEHQDAQADAQAHKEVQSNLSEEEEY